MLARKRSSYSDSHFLRNCVWKQYGPTLQEQWEQAAMQNVIDYAERHQYHLQLSGHIDKGRHPAWSKVRAWQHLLLHYDWVWQTDADMAILDTHRRLETFIDDQYDIIIGRDCNIFHVLLERNHSVVEALHMSINTGSFFLKSSAWTLDFLNRLYETNGPHIPDIDIWWENAAMMYLADMERLESHFKIVPGRLFNAWPPTASIHFTGRNISKFCNPIETTFYKPGDFAIHFVAGSKHELTSYL